MEPQPQIADKDMPIRVRVLINKMIRWLREHPEAVAWQKGRVIFHFAGTDISAQVEHFHDNL